MTRLFDRFFLVGLCVIALLIGVPSLLLKNRGHRAGDQEWSSRQRASVSTGSVREEAPPPSIASAPGNERQLMTKQPPDATHGASVRSLHHTKLKAQIDPRESQRLSHSRLPKKTRVSNGTARVNEAKHATLSEERGPQPTEKPEQAQSAQGESHIETTVNSSASQRRDLDHTPSADTDPSKDALRPPSYGNPAQREVLATHDAQGPIVATSPHPKTREDVENELRKARMNGSLPRFGNPDPYGPGGSPSKSN